MEPEQISLFEMEHVHKFIIRQGPILVQDICKAGDNKYCWTCARWIWFDGLDSWTAQDMSLTELISYNGKSVLLGEISRNTAVEYVRHRYNNYPRKYGEYVYSGEIARQMDAWLAVNN